MLLGLALTEGRSLHALDRAGVFWPTTAAAAASDAKAAAAAAAGGSTSAAASASTPGLLSPAGACRASYSLKLNNLLRKISSIRGHKARRPATRPVLVAEMPHCNTAGS